MSVWVIFIIIHLCLHFALRDLFTFNPSVDLVPAISCVMHHVREHAEY